MDCSSIKAIQQRHTKRPLESWELALNIEKLLREFYRGKSPSKRELGYFSENLVAHFFCKHLSYKVLAQNVYTRYGEVDLILENSDKVKLALEVKSLLSFKEGVGVWSYAQRQRFLQSIYSLKLGALRFGLVLLMQDRISFISELDLE